MSLRKHKHYGKMSITLQMSLLTFEAESIAYVVCQYFGIETGENSFGYVASWSKDKELKELFSSLETIKETASQIIDGTEKHFEKNSEYTIGEDLSKVCEPSFYLPKSIDYQR